MADGEKGEDELIEQRLVRRMLYEERKLHRFHFMHRWLYAHGYFIVL